MQRSPTDYKLSDSATWRAQRLSVPREESIPGREVSEVAGHLPGEIALCAGRGCRGDTIPVDCRPRESVVQGLAIVSEYRRVRSRQCLHGAEQFGYRDPRVDDAKGWPCQEHLIRHGESQARKSRVPESSVHPDAADAGRNVDRARCCLQQREALTARSPSATPCPRRWLKLVERIDAIDRGRNGSVNRSQCLEVRSSCREGGTREQLFRPRRTPVQNLGRFQV